MALLGIGATVVGASVVGAGGTGNTYTVSFSAGVYALTGIDVTFSISEPLGFGSFALSGQDATFIYRRPKILTAGAGIFAVTPQTAILTKAFFLNSHRPSIVVRSRVQVTTVAKSSVQIATRQRVMVRTNS
jgi:hypothetical protein